MPAQKQSISNLTPELAEKVKQRGFQTISDRTRGWNRLSGEIQTDTALISAGVDVRAAQVRISKRLKSKAAYVQMINDAIRTLESVGVTGVKNPLAGRKADNHEFVEETIYS